MSIVKDASSNWPSSGLFSPSPISGRTALGDRVIQSLKPRTAHLSANRLPFFSSPVTGNPCNDSGRHRICRSAVSTTRAIHQSVAPHPLPIPCIPSNDPTANEILRRGARKHDLAYVPSRPLHDDELVPRVGVRARTCRSAPPILHRP